MAASSQAGPFWRPEEDSGSAVEDGTIPEPQGVRDLRVDVVRVMEEVVGAFGLLVLGAWAHRR